MHTVYHRCVHSPTGKPVVLCLRPHRSLPIFIDESCHFAKDIAQLYHCIDGVNIKLLKCGGITEALKIIHTAKTFDLKIMLGCFGETDVSISGALTLSYLADYLDLDSILNIDKTNLNSFNSLLNYKQGNLSYKQSPIGHGVTL